MKYYLGYDGSYVLSRYPLRKFQEGETAFLVATKKGRIYDLGENPYAGDMLFSSLRLKPFDVVEIDIKMRTRTSAKNVRRRK